MIETLSRVCTLNDPQALATVLQHLREGICVATADGEVLEANPAFLEFFGAMGVGELGRTAAGQLFAQGGSNDDAIQGFECDIRRVDGELRTALVKIFPGTEADSGDPISLAIVSDISERKRLENELMSLTEQAQRDPLTGCFNRRYLAHFALRAESSLEPWGCIVIDIDKFKVLNDTFGHDEGDRALVRLSRFLIRRTRADEAVVRMGGDEFLLLLAGADDVTTEMVADRLRLAAAKEDLPSFSLGWAARDGEESLLSTIDHADHRLIAVKSADRMAMAVPMVPHLRAEEPRRRRSLMAVAR